MKAYLDITLLPADDIGFHFLWGKVYQQVHLAFVENKNTDGSSSCGVTFPEFNEEKHRLGRKLRVFAPDEKKLEKLDLPKWLERLSDYVHITLIREVPNSVSNYVCFRRVHEKPSKENLARRATKRKNISYEQALQDRSDYYPKLNNAPYIQLQSLSNNTPYRILITRDVVEQQNNESMQFNTYGLGTYTPLPMF